MEIGELMTPNPEGKRVGIVSLGDIATKSNIPLKAEAITAVSEPGNPRR